MKFIAAYRDADGNEQINLYNNHGKYFEDTFCPECEQIFFMTLTVSGKTYKERKEDLRNKAIEWSHNNIGGLSYGEMYEIGSFFYEMGSRYGLLTEFRNEGIC